MRLNTMILALLAMAACGPVGDHDPVGGLVGGTGGVADNATDSGTDGDSDSASVVLDTGGEAESSSDGESTGDEPTGTSGDPSACILPWDGSWCIAQLEVAKAIGCSTSDDPATCYAVVAAMYTIGDGAMVEAADCVPNPAPDDNTCMMAITQCAAQPAAECLFNGAGLNACQVLPQMQGIGLEMSEPFCLAILDAYGD